VTAYEVTDRYDDEYFGDLAERYRKRTRFARQRIRNVFSLLPSLKDRTVVDLGCGMGTFTIEAARRGARAVGVDMMTQALSAARRVSGGEGVPALFVRADAASLPIDTASADIVIAADLTEHLDDETLSRVLAEARRILRPGGRLVLYTPERRHIFEQLREKGILRDGDPSHIGLRSAEELATAVTKAGLEPEPVRFLPSHLPLWNLLERTLARWMPLLRRRIGLVARAQTS
jgi:SAM-dependent methyltransferase